MSFRQFVEECTSLVKSAMDSLGYSVRGPIIWSEPRDISFGDVSFRVAFDLAREKGRKPSDIAREIAEKIRTSGKILGTLISRVESHPSGHLNFKLELSGFTPRVLHESTKDAYGKLDLGMQRTVIVEHTAVNPNKAVHIGHVRNIAIGDFTARVLAFTNYAVSVLNYIDDSGLQVADIVVGILYLGMSKDAPPGLKYDHYAGDQVYVNVNRRYESDPELRDKQKLILKGIEEANPEIFPLALELTDKILREQLKTSWRLGAFYDLLAYESDIIVSRLWQNTFAELKGKGIAKLETSGKFQGCYIVTVEGEVEGEDKVLVRSDGTATYVAKDIPLAALKMGLVPDPFSYDEYLVQPNGMKLFRTREKGGGKTEESPIPWGANQSITVIDSRQARLQRIITYILEQMNNQKIDSRYIHLGYSIISLTRRTVSQLSTIEDANLSEGLTKGGKDVVTMAGRHGTYVNADDVIELVKKRARVETKKRNPANTDDKWLDGVAEKIAISAIRFSFLKQDLDKMIVYDIEDSLQLIGETGPYMLYTYARASSIISKLEKMEQDSVEIERTLEESEAELVKAISKFDIAVEKSAKLLEPKWVAHYSYNLCEAFNKFYEKNRVLQESDPKTRIERIRLVMSFRSVLKKSLWLLGIEALDKI